MLDCGGAWVPDTGGGEGEGTLPPEVTSKMGQFGQKGVVVSGVVTWIVAQIGTHGTEIWKSLAERCFSEVEVTAAKEALKSARGDVLNTLVKDFKVNRQCGGKKASEIDDIKNAVVALEAAGEMPLVMATSGQMTRCPQSWGVPTTATVQDVMGKVMELEKAMSDSMGLQREQMEQLKLEMVTTRSKEVRLPKFPETCVTGDETPSKKRKILASSEESGSTPHSYAGVAGVQPLNVQQQQQHGMNLLKNILTSQKQQQEPPKTKPPQRNICFGTAKPDGTGDSGTEMLAADVSLVASGVGKGCTPEKLKSFLEGKGIHAVEVVMLTKPDVVNEVRTLTFRVAVKASEYEAALKLEVWPYRVGVRHFRAPKRERSEGGWEGQSERSGGHVSGAQGGGGGGDLGGRHHRPGTPKYPPGHAARVGQYQQYMGHHQPAPIEISTFYSLLSAMGGGMELPKQ